MNTQILEQLSFGFELEGYFKAPLNVVPGTFKSDASVHIDNPFGSGDSVPYRKIQGERPSTEFASEVINDFATLVSRLDLFKEHVYAWGDGCGLHFHIGMKDSSKKFKLFNVVANFDFIQKIQDIARSSFCSHQTHRLVDCNNHYYQGYLRKEQFVSDVQRQEKYRFLRFHPLTNTLEFRFMSPCEHKVDNVAKLVELLTDYIGESKQLRQIGQVNLDVMENVRKGEVNIVSALLTPEEVERKVKARKSFCANWIKDRIPGGLLAFKKNGNERLQNEMNRDFEEWWSFQGGYSQHQSRLSDVEGTYGASVDQAFRYGTTAGM